MYGVPGASDHAQHELGSCKCAGAVTMDMDRVESLWSFFQPLGLVLISEDRAQ